MYMGLRFFFYWHLRKGLNIPGIDTKFSPCPSQKNELDELKEIAASIFKQPLLFSSLNGSLYYISLA
jgi:hypothetical protein